jgi:hypothetical protein
MRCIHGWDDFFYKWDIEKSHEVALHYFFGGGGGLRIGNRRWLCEHGNVTSCSIKSWRNSIFLTGIFSGKAGLHGIWELLLSVLTL